MAKARKLPSGNYRVRVYIGKFDGKEKFESITAPTKKQAEFLAAEYAISRREKSRFELTVGEAIDQYIASKDAVLSPSTIREYKRMRKNYLQDLVNIKLKDLTQHKVQNSINAELKRENGIRLSRKTLKNAHGLLTAAVSMFNPDPHFKTKLPEKEELDLYEPTTDDIRRLMLAIKGTEIEIPVLLSACTAIRRGEICALSNIDPDKNTITIRHSMVKTYENKWVVNPVPKSRAGNRTIEIPKVVMERLVARKESGLPLIELNPNQITARFNKILKKNNIPHFRFHDLRHFNASIMAMLNIPDTDAMERGGWATMEVMKKIYQNSLNESRTATNNKINSYFSDLIQNPTQNLTQI